MSNDLPNRHTIRLTGYDYSESGWYFITICTHNREHILGDIVDGKMILNDVGKMIEFVWLSLPDQFPITLDAFQIMPNHIHMIINIRRGDPCGRPCNPARNNPTSYDKRATTTTNRATTRVAPTIGDVVGAFKSLTTHEYVICVKNKNWKRFDKRLFQRNYYEHIIRNQTEHTKISEYITQNPVMWERDRNNI